MIDNASGAQAGSPPSSRMRTRLRTWWTNSQWIVVLCVGLLSMVLGLIGWIRYMEALDLPWGLADAVYSTIQLFTLQISGLPEGPGFPPELQVAKFLAPVVAGYTAFRAFLAVFQETHQQLGARMLRDHIVIVGLDDFSFALARKLRRDALQVVVIHDGGSGLAQATIDLGARVVHGDGRDEALLGRVGVGRCRHVVINLASDEVSGEVLSAVDRVASDASHPLECHIVVSNSELGRHLRAAEISSALREGLDLDLVNLPSIAAGALLDEHPLAGADSVAIIGDSELADGLLLRLAVDEIAPELTVALAGPDAETQIKTMTSHQRALEDVGRLVAVEGDLRDPSVTTKLAESVELAYVAFDDTSAGLAVSLDLLDAGISVVACMAHSSGLSNMVGSDTLTNADRLQIFGVLDAVAEPDRILGGFWERLSRAVHQHYQSRRGEIGDTAADDASRVGWNDLSSSLQASNRSQARGIGDKLGSIGARIVPIGSRSAADAIEFTDAEIESMAILEHDRWVTERRTAGWTDGPRDPDRRTTPFLVGWDELDEEVRDRDREAVRNIPAILAAVGCKAVRESVGIESADAP